MLGLPSEADWPVNSVIPLDSFHNNSNLRRVQRSNLRNHLPGSMSEHALDLLDRMLDYNTLRRITAQEALTHPFFDDGEAAENAENQPVGAAKSAVEAGTDGKIDCELEGRVVGDEESRLGSLPDITNIFQPNILKRKRYINANANNSNNSKN